MNWYKRTIKEAVRKYKKKPCTPFRRDKGLKEKVKKLLNTINPVTDKPYNRLEISQSLGISWKTINAIAKKIKEEESESQVNPIER